MSTVFVYSCSLLSNMSTNVFVALQLVQPPCVSVQVRALGKIKLQVSVDPLKAPESGGGGWRQEAPELRPGPEPLIDEDGRRHKTFDLDSDQL